MFMEKLSSEARQAVLDLLVTLAAADHDIHEQEMSYLQKMAASHHLHLRNVTDPVDVDIAMSQLLSYTDKLVALQHMIQLSYQDGHFGPEEQQLVRDFAQRMGITNQVVWQNIEHWVRRGLQWMEEGEAMMSGLPYDPMP